MNKVIIFTDLDGTLLDQATYSFDEASDALELIRSHRIPLVICSSKTRMEIEHYREKLGNMDPFISENGGAVFVPLRYFPQDTWSSVPSEEDEKGHYRIIRLGARYQDLRKAVFELRGEGFDIQGFGDMIPEEIAAATGLNGHEAVMAKAREFDEPFIFHGSPEGHEKLVNAVKEKGFNITRGAFYHILGDSDKGKAVDILSGLYRRRHGGIVTAALGDSPNDLPMLRCVDHPVIVEKHGGGYDPHFDGENFNRAEGAGPAGWNGAVIKFLEETGL